MQFIDMDLARRVEMAEANAGRECADAFHGLHPEFPVAVKEMAGGIAVFAGPDSPITQATGVGLNGPVSDDELDALGEFFKVRNAPAAVELCPLVEMSLYEKFATRGYKLVEVSDVLIRDLARAPISATTSPGVTIRAATREESKLWTQTVAQGFAEHIPVTQAILDVMEGFCHRSGPCCFFLAFVDGEPAGGAVVSTYQGVGGLFGASTLPALRRRGVQVALLNARLAWARDHGCDLAVSIARPGSTSHRNIERFGFRVAYTRTKLVRPLA
jgi:GNAT superfamily N-acetyltransferase